MTADQFQELNLIQASRDQRAALRPVNNTKITHRGRDRSTDLETLRRLVGASPVANVQAEIDRLENEI